ncbi:aminotransferase class IV [Botrimarina sp.]|uniref:aminotransferase class IV n=1 Tax=Botrimarina sp. TaxID=2795802 RepID=UPI0032EAEA87
MARTAYFNGEWIDQGRLAIPVGDPGFALGVTVTERLRTFNGVVWRRAEHVARLRRSCEIVGIPTAVAEELDAAISEYAARHPPESPPGQPPHDLAIVAFATPGASDQPTRCVHGFPLPFKSWARQYDDGVALRTSSHRQVPAECWPAELKCRSRMHYYLADREAAAAEPGARALLLDREGFVGEASTANVVLYNHREGIVSPRMEKVLPGVSVAVVRELAAAEGVAFTERDLTVAELAAADEVWLASTSVCLLPVVRLDGRPIGAGKPGAAFGRFLAAWSRLVGLEIAEQARRCGD